MSYQVEFPIVGVTFRNDDTGERRQDILKRFLDWHTETFSDYFDYDGNPVTEFTRPEFEAQHEPWNRYDRNAVAIHILKPSRCAGKIGYLSKEQSPKVVKHMTEKLYLGCFLSSVGRGLDSNNIGLRVFLRFDGEGKKW